MNGSSKPRGWTLVPPPLLFALPLIVGLLLQRRVPLMAVASGWGDVLRATGIALAVIGAAHTFPSLAIFARSKTTIIPHHRSAVLVTRGAYRWTRNPMYVGLTLMYVGIAIFAGSLWPFLFIPFVLLIMNSRIIPMEERQLEDVFGPQYVDYKARVRRWL